MSPEADFCDGRLRLQAFLRVAEDGMPARPTRFRRRGRAIVKDIEALSQLHHGRADNIVTLSRQDASNQSSGNASVDIAHSLTPEASLIGSGGGHPGDCEQPQRVQHPLNQQAEGRVHATIALTSPTKYPNASSTRRRRQIPVNGLALLRTTSSDGLPQPSDADQVFATPLAALDPIEESQMAASASASRSCGTFAAHRVQKHGMRDLKRTANVNSSKDVACVLRRRLIRPHPVHVNATHHKIYWSTSAIGSDGFFGAELNIQHTKRIMSPRILKHAQMKERASASAELSLAYGHLPTPSAENALEVMLRTGQSWHAGARMPS